MKRRTIEKEDKIEERETKKIKRKEAKIKKKPVKKNTKKKTIQEEVNEAYQAWCNASDKETDFNCTAVQNIELLQGMLYVSKHYITIRKTPNIYELITLYFQGNYF